jgi:hypothetical protein
VQFETVAHAQQLLAAHPEQLTESLYYYRPWM